MLSLVQIGEEEADWMICFRDGIVQVSPAVKVIRGELQSVQTLSKTVKSRTWSTQQLTTPQQISDQDSKVYDNLRPGTNRGFARWHDEGSSQAAHPTKTPCGLPPLGSGDDN